ncbi:MAG: PKD domain-containing protein [Chitinophagaceae bacterium]
MKRLSGLFILLLLLGVQSLYAKHVKGGHIEYKYNGVGATAGTSNYTITVTVFFSCTTNGPKDNVYLGVFDAVTNTSVLSKLIATSTDKTVTKTSSNPCMSNPPTICYEIRTYVYTTDLPDNSNGYILAVQDALRIDGIVNISNSASDGITLTANIPGKINGVDYHINNSPTFLFKDTAIVCYKGAFNYQFAATDADGDSLSYEFGNGLNVANPGGNTSSNPPAAPPYAALTYTSGYSGASPLGSGVTIDPVTGLISGNAPTTTGEYVVAVYVKEWRNGVLIATLKKELQIYVFNCSLVAASLNTSYINCDNYTFTFENESGSSTVSSYFWDFGVTTITTDTSSQPTPTYTYPAAGDYQLKLKVSTSGGCLDSATAPVKVYPGFTPGFTVTGSCYQSPFTFKDNTTAQYGIVNSWSWDFGDPSTTTDTSTKQNPTYQYSTPQTVTVLLTVGSSKGCVDTVSKTVAVNGKPDIYLPFTDTLICSIDSLPLIVQSSSATSYSWTPAYNIINANTANPIVYPKDTTIYTVTVQDKGCIDSASIKVNVLDYITVTLPADTTICQTDSIVLRPTTYGLSFLWSPATGLSSTSVKYPSAAPTSNITYYLTANLGKCQAKASENIKVVAYPKANAGIDTTICYAGTATLNGSITGAYFNWAPASSITNGNTLQPTANPLNTTAYILTALDTLGCPKPFRDTVVVTVLPKIQLFAGNDTTVVVGQPLQLNAISSETGLNYLWVPSDWLSNAAINNPIATISSSSVDSITYIVKATNAIGCYATDNIKIIVYKTKPDIFMPNAFTPNADGVNDVIRPVLVGIANLDYFRIYNRWGQLIFSTTQNAKGWDGSIGGHIQDPGAYVYVVQGKDYLGKTISKKGSFILIK